MRARIAEYFRRLFVEPMHYVMDASGFPLTGAVPFGHPLHATPL